MVTKWYNEQVMNGISPNKDMIYEAFEKIPKKFRDSARQIFDKSLTTTPTPTPTTIPTPGRR